MYNDYLDFVERSFHKCFQDKGYVYEKPVKITSGIDSSVTFIGAAISPLKKYVLNGNIGNDGRFILQNSIRCRSLKNLQNSEYNMFGSYFNCMGALVNYSDLEKLVTDVFDYLIKYLRINLEDIVIRINTQDKDLLKSIERIDKKIIREYDTFEKQYYAHKYGLDKEKIRGRNFNIGIRKKSTDTFLDIGNIIVIENDIEKLAVEVGLGNCTISMSHFGVDSTVASSRFADIYKIDTVEKMKFADAIIATAVLMFEDVRKIKSPSWYQHYFRRYRRAIAFWKDKLNTDYYTIVSYIKRFLFLEYKSGISMSDREIISYIEYKKN